MANVSVYDGKLMRRVSRSTAHRLELTGWYDRIGNTLTRKSHRNITSFTVGKSTEHAPDRLPPVDLPGLKFKLKRTNPPYFGSLIGQRD